MFSSYIENQWRQGKVKIGLPAHGHGDQVAVEATGFAGCLAGFLTSAEKRRLADLAKHDAKALLKSEAHRPANANCPINEQTADGVTVGRCYFHLEDGHTCPRHGDVSVEVERCDRDGMLTLENDLRARRGEPQLGNNQ